MSRTWMMLGVVLVVAVLASGSGCLGGDEGEDLVGKWEIDINTFGGFDTTYDVSLSVEFMDDMQVRGFSACNNFNGTYEVPGAGELEMGALASTRKACEDDFMFAEGRFLTMLGRVKQYEVADGVLHMKDVNGQELVALQSASGGAAPH